MAMHDVIPNKFLKQDSVDLNLADYPVIHTWQSIIWYRPVGVPSAPASSSSSSSAPHDSTVSANIDIQTIGIPDAEALTRSTFEVQGNRSISDTRMPVQSSDLS